MKLYQKGKKKPLKAKVVVKGEPRRRSSRRASSRRARPTLIKITYTKIKDEAGNPLVKPKKWQVTVK